VQVWLAVKYLAAEGVSTKNIIINNLLLLIIHPHPAILSASFSCFLSRSHIASASSTRGVNIWYQIRRSMEPYPFHYTCRSWAEDSIDPTVKFMFEKLQKMEAQLSDRIEGCCQGIEHRMADSKQRMEEWLISLEMARTESEPGRAKIEKQVEGLKLKLHHVGRFLEHENLGDPQGKPRIF
jgi:hypothetical protein